MPCDTIQTNSVNLGKLGDKNLLRKALEALGHGNVKVNGDGSVTFGDYYNGGRITPDGVMETRGDAVNITANDVKRGYAVETVKLAGQKFGWNVTEKSKTQFAVTRKF